MKKRDEIDYLKQILLYPINLLLLISVQGFSKFSRLDLLVYSDIVIFVRYYMKYLSLRLGSNGLC